MTPSLSYRQILTAAYCLAIFLTALCIASITPPMQSPDEPAHVSRAYLLSQGKIMLDSPQGQDSGGFIDGGLVSYAQTSNLLAGKPAKHWSAEEEDFINALQWSHSEIYYPISGTGYYFPLIYAPQAIGLLSGKALDLSIDTSYKLSRLLALLCATLILFAAFRLHQPPPSVYLLLALPMALFQSASASLDGMSNAVAILCLSLFLRIFREPDRAKPWLFYLLAASCFIVASCRAHLLPLIALPFAAWLIQRRNSFLIVAILCSLLTLSWTLLAMKTTVHATAHGGNLTGFYVSRPLLFLKIVARTLAEGSLTHFYWQSFIGVLGWLDAYFSKWVYFVISGLLVLAAATGFTCWRSRPLKLAALLLVILSLASILLIFFALLTTWTTHPATVIQGVQGRYFFIPVMMLAYALTPSPDYSAHWKAVFATGLIGVFITLVAATTLPLLVKRYFQSAEAQPLLKVTMQPSAALSAETAIPLRMTITQERYNIPLSSLSILFGTYARSNPGTATLVLTTKTGGQREYPLDLSKLADNRYHTVEIEPLAYTGGSIRFQTGGGVSTWEAHREDGRVLSCLIYGGANGHKRPTPDCPPD